MFRRHDKTGDPRAGQRGQALALFAGGLVALLVATGFVLDGGIVIVHRRDAQNSADLGALAGTAIIAEFHKTTSGDGADVFAAIDEAVEANGCTTNGEPCDWTASYVRPTTGYNTSLISGVVNGGVIPPTAQGVQVMIDRHPATNFLRVVGQDEWDVTADATALTARIDPIGAGILLPIGFDPGPGRDNLDPDTNYEFSEGKDAPGAFSWLSWFDINSATELENNVCNPRNPPYTFPVYVPSGPGKMSKKQVRDCLDEYIGETVYIPLWDDCALGPGVKGTGSHVEYCIVGVAAFILGGHDTPTIDNVWGTFQEYVTFTSISSNFAGPPCDPATDTTCQSPSSFLGLID